MICPDCRSAMHILCREGTWCDCQHLGFAMPATLPPESVAGDSSELAPEDPSAES